MKSIKSRLYDPTEEAIQMKKKIIQIAYNIHLLATVPLILDRYIQIFITKNNR